MNNDQASVQNDDEAKITLRFFEGEELSLMRGCVAAIGTGKFVNRDDVVIISGWEIEEYAGFLTTFDTLSHLSNEQLKLISSAVHLLDSVPGGRESVPKEECFESLGISPLHLRWFADRLSLILVDWADYVYASPWEEHRDENGVSHPPGL